MRKGCKLPAAATVMLSIGCRPAYSDAAEAILVGTVAGSIVAVDAQTLQQRWCSNISTARMRAMPSPCATLCFMLHSLCCHYELTAHD